MSVGKNLRAREIPWVITVVSALITIIAFFFGFKQPADAAAALKLWVVILAGFAVAGLGPIAIVLFHVSRIRQRASGTWLFSVWLLVVFFVTVIMGLFIVPRGANQQFLWLYNNLYLPTNATVYALTAFWIVSAAYRAFKVKTWEAALLFASAVIIIFSNAPFGGVIFPGVSNLGQWVLNVPNSSAFRGIIIGAAIGAIALTLRVLIGHERSTMGGQA